MPKKVHTYRYANGRFKHFVVWQFESWLDGPQDLPRLGMSKIQAILVRFPAFLSSSFISPFSLSSLFTFTRPRANGMKRMKMGKIHFIDILETSTKPVQRHRILISQYQNKQTPTVQRTLQTTMTRTKQIQLFLLHVFAIVNIHVANAETYEKNYMVQSHLDSLSRIAPMLGESAIVDKETGRVFWQGGKQSLFDSVVGHSYLSNQQEGVLKHVRATLFSCILWMSFIRYLSEWGLKQKILSRLTETLTLTSERVLDVIRILTRAALFCLACLPKFNREFIVVVAIMYFLESYTCSTRKYLDNTLSCPDEIESFMEGLREEEPCVSWKIRCYHYEKRKWLHLVLLIDVWKYFSGVFQGKNTEEENNLDEKIILGPSMFTKKVISHQMKKVYQVRSCKDETIGGIWKQAQAATTVMAAFTKISLYKLLLFANKEARIDYFQQQSDFISREGKTDVYAEFSTHVDGE